MENLNNIQYDPLPKFTTADLELVSCALRKLLVDSTVDAVEITDILTIVRNKQRRQVKEIYLRQYGCDLIADLHSKLGDKYTDVISGFMLPPVEFLCEQLHKAMDTNETSLAEIICTKNNEELTEIVTTYEKMYNRSLAEELCSEQSNHCRRLLKLIVSGKRDPDTIIDPEKAQKQAEALYDGGVYRVGSDQDVFNNIIARTSCAQLRLVFPAYKELAGNAIEQMIMSHMFEDLREPMIAIVQCIQNPKKYFARRLVICLDPARADDTTLTRIIISRAEIDLGDIRKEFEVRYGTTLMQQIVDGAPPVYARLLLQLVGIV